MEDPAPIGQEFLAGGGVMGQYIRSHDWAGSALGEPQSWPQALRTTVRILLSTGHPTMIMWGPDLICLYNDPFSSSLGPEKHPGILGMPARQAWAEVWPLVGDQLERVLRGEGAVWQENVCVPIIRFGELQEVYWTYSYSPIDEPDSPNGVGGILVTTSETTRQVLAERKLATEREKFVQLFDQAPTFLAVLRGPDHLIEMANPGYLALVSHRPVVGRTVAEALPEAEAQGYVRLLDEVYRSGMPYRAEGSRIVLDGKPGGPLDERFVDFVYQPMTSGDGEVTGILVQGVDVTSRAVTDRDLAMSRARLDYATRLSGVGFWYCDLPFSQLEWDERVKEHFFFPPTARITIDDFYSRIHEEDRLPTRQAIEASIGEKIPYDIVYRTVHPDSGEIKWIRALGGTVYAADGTPTRFDGVTVDVSAQRQVQQHLAELNNQLREQDRRKDEFIATLSHELRNPLAPVRAAAKIIALPNAAPEQLRQAQAIVERQVNHMALLLDDLLDISRITQGKLLLKKEPSPLVPLIDAAVEAVRPKLDSKNQQLELHLPTDPIVLDVDRMRLAQVISNLLLNAAKYSDPGSRIELSCSTQGDTLTLAVRDSGIGIPRESIADLFHIFWQADSSSPQTGGGLGIGLALVKGITELHGGSVEARSEGLGKGSEFLVRLPFVLDRKPAPPPAAVDAVSSTRRRILVADDNKDAADSLAMLLELEGHEVRVAHLGQSAISLAQAFRPDTALLDIGMPDMSGYQVAEFLRRESWAKDLVLIALTGWGQESDRRRARESGFDHHLVKPVDVDKLVSLIASGSA